LRVILTLLQVIAATNRIDILDPALLRSGRLDRKIEFPLPNETARARILEIHSRKMTCSPDVNYEELARSTDEFNGAQLKAVCVEAGMIALREGASKLTHEHFLSGIAEGTRFYFFDLNTLVMGFPQCKAKRRTTSCISHDHCIITSGYIIHFSIVKTADWSL
jgi:26S proteasome regulatory subunit T5